MLAHASLRRRLPAISIALLVCLGISSCAGVRETDETFMVHAESFRIFGFAIPRDDMAAADELVDPDWVITSTHSTPADWTSLLGILGNLLWFHRTVITGCKDCSAEG